jgi:hypothetical protein
MILTSLRRSAGRRFLFQRADLAHQRWIVAHDGDDLVVIVHERGRDDLAFVGVAVAAASCAGATAEERTGDGEVGLLGAPLCGRHLDAAPRVSHEHARLRFLEPYFQNCTPTNPLTLTCSSQPIRVSTPSVT